MTGDRDDLKRTSVAYFKYLSQGEMRERADGVRSVWPYESAAVVSS